jgi:UDP-N-acetyl-2-amino-2-deoxyglucuronate dehydrogenase
LNSAGPSPLTFALVGCGTISHTQARALAGLPDLARLVACVDVDPAAAAKLAEECGAPVRAWTEVLADPAVEAVSVCTPSGRHGEVALAALAAGKHVIVEKPMEVTPAACAALRDAARQAGRQLAVISQHRFDPASQAVHAALARGELGRIHLVDARVPWYRTQAYYDAGDWRGTWALDGGGCLMNQGIHTLDLLRWLAGPVVSVYAQARTAAHERIEVEDNLCATLVFASGAIGTLMASTSCLPGFPARLALHGTAGSAVIEGDNLALLMRSGHETVTGQGAADHALQVAGGGTRGANAALAAGTARSVWQWGDAHAAQLADFVRAVREDRPPLVDGEAGYQAVALIDAIYRSARLGQPVTLNA